MLLINATLQNNSGDFGPPLLGYTLLSDFEATTGITSNASSTISLHTGERKVLGAAGVRIQANGATAGGGLFLGVPLVNNPIDYSGYSRIAYCVDMGDFQYTETNGPISPRFTVGATVYGLFPPTSTGYTLPLNPFTGFTRGKVWVSKLVKNFRVTNSAGVQLDSLGPVTATFGATINAGLNVDYVVDALVVPDNGYKPSIVIGFDDLHSSQLDDAVPIMQARGLVGTFYIPTGTMTGLGAGAIAQLAAAKAAGFGLSLDSGPLDEPCCVYDTPAAWIAVMQDMQATMLATFGPSVTEDIKHVAYSWGRHGYVPDFNVTITCDGSNTLVINGSNGYNCSIGQPVFGVGVPAGTVVSSILSQTTVTTNNAIPAGSRTLIFGGLPPIFTITANDTDFITVASTAKLLVGFEVTMTSPASVIGARILSIPSDTAVQLDRVVPASCVRIRFGHTDGAWWHTKIQDAMIAAGFLSGRPVVSASTEGYFTGFGVDAKTRMVLPSTGVSGSNPAVIAERLDLSIANGTDSEWYFHAILDVPFFTACMDLVKLRKDAGLINVVTKHANVARMIAARGIE